MILLFLLAVYKFCVALTHTHSFWWFFKKLSSRIYAVDFEWQAMTNGILMVPWHGGRNGGLKVRVKKWRPDRQQCRQISAMFI